MTKHSALLAAAILLTLAACDRPLTAEYTATEAPNRLTIDDASRNYTLRFAPGSASLARGEVEHLDRLVASGEIGGHDRITISPAGPPALAARRSETVAAVMLNHGMTVAAARLGVVPPDSAILEVERYLVSLPPCPNWSKPPSSDFTNMRMSNFGCATATNFGEMVANPADLAGGRPLGMAAGAPAAAAIARYNADKVVLPTANSALPIAAPTNAAPGAAN